MIEDCTAISCPVPKVTVQDYLNQYSLNGTTVSNTQATFIISGIPITIPAGTIVIHLPTLPDGSINTNGATTMTYQGCSGPISLPVPRGSTAAQIQAIAQQLAQLAAAQLAACNIANQPVPPTPPPPPPKPPVCYDFNTLVWGHGGDGSGGGTGNAAANSITSSAGVDVGSFVGSNTFNIFVPVGCDRTIKVRGTVVVGAYDPPPMGVNLYTIQVYAGGPGVVFLSQGNSPQTISEDIAVSWPPFNGNQIHISLSITHYALDSNTALNLSIEIV